MRKLRLLNTARESRHVKATHRPRAVSTASSPKAVATATALHRPCRAASFLPILLSTSYYLLVASGTKKARSQRLAKTGHITWRRPTLTGPIAQLPSALKCFTSGFGTGPGGSTLLWSPESRRDSGKDKVRRKKDKAPCFFTAFVLRTSGDFLRLAFCKSCSGYFKDHLVMD